MKRLLIFGYTMEVGGAEKALLDTLKYLHKKVEIDLYLLEKKGELLKEIPKNINVYQLKNNIFEYSLFRFIPYFRKKKINQIANTKDYSCAIGYMEGRSGTWVSDIKKDIRKYAWIHNDVSKLGIGISDSEAKRSYNNIDNVICVSKLAKKAFCNKYEVSPNKVKVIYNYIDEKDIIKKSKEYEVQNDVFTFVNVGIMRNSKRQDRLIYAAEYLKEKGYDFQIQIVGAGTNFEMIKNMVKEKKLFKFVKLVGLKTNPYPYIKNADYIVSSSSDEGYGIVIKEALFLKKRIISTDTLGPREILKDGEFGVIVKNDDESLKYIMEDVMKNKEKFKYLDETLKKYNGDNLEIQKQTIELLDL